MGCCENCVATFFRGFYQLISMLLIQILFILFFILALVMTWRRQGQRVIPTSEALAWSLIWVSGAIAVVLPNSTTTIAHFFGVGRGADFIMYGSVSALFLLVFKLFIQHEKLERKLTDVVRQEALRDIKDKQA